MRNVFKYIFIILICAATAAILKLLIPGLSFYWGDWFHSSIRNKLGVPVVMILYELYYLGWLYVLATICMVMASHFFLRNQGRRHLFIIMGTFITILIFSIYKIFYYINSARIYANHDKEHLSKGWYYWIAVPQDIELLFIYSLTGLIGGYLYYQWLASTPKKILVK